MGRTPTIEFIHYLPKGGHLLGVFKDIGLKAIYLVSLLLRTRIPWPQGFWVIRE